MQLHCIWNAIASRLKVTIVTTIKKGLPGNPHIAHIAHYKKRSRERHKTKNKRLANFLAKQMKNTQTSHDIKKVIEQMSIAIAHNLACTNKALNVELYLGHLKKRVYSLLQ